VRDLLRELVPDGSKFLTVSAPGSVELDEHVFGGVIHDSFVVGSNNNGQGAVVVLGLGLGFEERRELAILEVSDEGSEVGDGGGGDVGFVSVLAELLAGLDETEAGEVSLGNSDKLGELGLDALGDSGAHEVDLSIKLLRGVSESGEGLVFGEKNKSGVALTEDGLDKVVVEFDQLGDGGSLGPGLESSRLSGVCKRRGLEVASKSDTGGGSSEVSSALGGGVVESELLAKRALGSLDEGVPEVAFLGAEVEKSELDASLSGGLEVIAGDFAGRRAGSLVNPADNGVGSSATRVVLALSINKPVKSGEALDVESAGEGLVLGGVNLGDVERRVLSSQSSSSLHILRSEFLAVSAPGGVELHKQVFVFSKFLVEVIISEDEHAFVQFSISHDGCHSHAQKGHQR